MSGNGLLFNGDLWYGSVAAVISGATVVFVRYLDNKADKKRRRENDENPPPAITLAPGESQIVLQEWHSIRDALRDEVNLCHSEREDLREQLSILQVRVARLERS
jgi:hypothetical protein